VRVGIVTDQQGVPLRDELTAQLECAGHAVIHFTPQRRNSNDEYLDDVVALSQAVAAGQADRGVIICERAGGAAVCANKVPGVRAELAQDHFSAWRGVEDDHMNVMCIPSRSAGPSVAWDLIQTFLAAQFGQAESRLQRLAKVKSLEE
jgi:ribose 5-phosphate isomerase B